MRTLVPLLFIAALVVVGRAPPAPAEIEKIVRQLQTDSLRWKLAQDQNYKNYITKNAPKEVFADDFIEFINSPEFKATAKKHLPHLHASPDAVEKAIEGLIGNKKLKRKKVLRDGEKRINLFSDVALGSFGVSHRGGAFGVHCQPRES